MRKKSKWITSLVSAMVLSLTIGVGSALIPNKVDATESVIADVNAFYSSNGEKLTGTADWESKSSGSGIAYSQFAKQGIVWNYDKGETITYDGLIDLSDNKVNDARNLADSIFEGYGLWASTMAENQAEWGTSVYETQLTFRFEDYLNSENYFDIVIADNAASFGYIAAMANNHAYRTDASKSKGQTQGAIRWGGTGVNTKGLVPADGLNKSSTQSFNGWGLYYQIGIAGYNANCINLSYNVEENAAFCRAFWGGSDYLCYIRDFGTVYDNYAWAGFTDPSKVKLKITCNNGHGALLIKSVDGKSLAYNTEPTVEAHKGSATFTNQNGLNVAKSTAEYETVTSNSNGVNLSTFAKRGVVLDYSAGSEYVYNKTIDLSDNNVNSLLFEGYGLVAKENNANFSVVFSEKDNPSNYFEVKMEDLQLSDGYWDGTANKSVSYIASSATGLSQGGYRMSTGTSFIGNRQLPAMYQYIKNADGTYSESSSYQKAGWTNAPFVGLNGNSLDTIRLFYDKEMNAIFYEARWYGNAWNTLICLRDFDGVMENATTWSGFTNASEIVVTIKGNTGSGSLLVMNVDGESLAYDNTTVVSNNGKYLYSVTDTATSTCNVDYNIPTITATDFETLQETDDFSVYVKVGDKELGAYSATLTDKQALGKYDILYYSDNEYTNLVAKTTLEVIHDYGTLIAEVPKTCTTNGTIAHYECSGCDKLFNSNKEEVTDLTILADHEYGDLVSAQAKTCTENGHVAHYQCSVCDKYFNESKEEIASIVIEAGHEYGDLVSAQAKTCTENGHVAHYQCSVCDKYFNESKEEVANVVIEAGHEYGNLVPAVAKTCTTDGNIAYYFCDECDKYFNENKEEVATIVVEAGHEYGNLVPAVAKTCTTDGNIAYYFCDECDKYFNENKEEVTSITVAKGHEYGNLVAAKAKTCTEDGHIAHYFCDECDKYFNENKEEVASVTIAKGHEYGTLVTAKAKTCTEDGHVAHYKCSDCNKYFNENKEEVASVVIPASHEYGDLIPEEAKSCSKDGTIAHYECAECGKTFNESKKEVDDITAAGGMAVALGSIGYAIIAIIKRRII